MDRFEVPEIDSASDNEKHGDRHECEPEHMYTCRQHHRQVPPDGRWLARVADTESTDWSGPEHSFQLHSRYAGEVETP
jgi:hypothetical protein